MADSSKDELPHGSSNSAVMHPASALLMRARTDSRIGRQLSVSHGQSGVSTPNAAVENPMSDTEKNLEDILEQNKNWVKTQLEHDSLYFQKMGAPQRPQYLWIGCADSRVSANEIMGLGPGEVFVHRNVANIVSPIDINCLSVLQYAVEVLRVRHIIVCGHYDCGGVRAAMERRDPGMIGHWLSAIRDTYRLHESELSFTADGEPRYKRLTELNVIEQCLNVFRTGLVQKRRIESLNEGHSHPLPRVHACVFDPKDGYLRKLTVDFKTILKRQADIYQLYDTHHHD